MAVKYNGNAWRGANRLGAMIHELVRKLLVINGVAAPAMAPIIASRIRRPPAPEFMLLTAFAPPILTQGSPQAFFLGALRPLPNVPQRRRTKE